MDYTLFTFWVAGGLLAAVAVPYVFRWVLLPLSRKTPTTLDARMLESIRAPVQFCVFAAGLNMAARITVFPEAQTAYRGAWTVFQGMVYVLWVLALTLTAYAATRAFIEWYHAEVAAKTTSTLDDQFAQLFRKVAKYLFFFIALTIVFEHFDVKITGLLATAGVASLAVALAAQDTLSNTIAGFILMADRPFQPGDRVQLADGKIGDVLDIGLRTTRILSFDHTVINIPNAELAKTEIINLNAPNPQFKIRATIGVAYGTDVRQVKRILLAILQAHPDVQREPPPTVYFAEFGESSLDLLYEAWIPDYREQYRIRDELNLAINDQFAAEAIEIPFPQRDIHIRKA